ncbi:hypothetical protein GEMRC1_010172 [Eukaryota sp. GEM-RC1]
MSSCTSFIQELALKLFLKYVTFDTEADPSSLTHPSSDGQTVLAKEIMSDLEQHGYKDHLFLSDTSILYVDVPSTSPTFTTGLSFLAHLDTSPESSGTDVKPIIHENYDGSPISFPDDPSLILSAEHDPDLLSYIGRSIITASGTTLLGADDKAGVAVLVATLIALKKFKISHGPLSFAFTCDEGNCRLFPFAFTIDGSAEGSLENSCFDAWGCKIDFHGHVTHPGNGKNKMVNAVLHASQFIAQVMSTINGPEDSSGNEGFCYVTRVDGTCESARVELILRDFDEEMNNSNILGIKKLTEFYQTQFKGLTIDMSCTHQYSNMSRFFNNHQQFIDIAKRAITSSGLQLKHEAIRGGN